MGFFDKKSSSKTSTLNDQANKSKMSTGAGTQLDLSNVNVTKGTLNVRDARNQSQHNSNNYTDSRKFTDASVKQKNSNNVYKDQRAFSDSSVKTQTTTHTTNIQSLDAGVAKAAISSVERMGLSTNAGAFALAKQSVSSVAGSNGKIIDMAKMFKDGTANNLESMKWIMWPILGVMGLVSAMAIWKK